MPWPEVTVVSSRLEFVKLASQPGTNIRELCRRFGVSPRTAYMWKARHAADSSLAGLMDRSRRPHESPTETASEVQAWMIALREEFPYWGSRKLRTIAMQQGYLPDGEFGGVPSSSTVTDILKRHGQLGDPEMGPRPAVHRFEHEAPNQLWQMDFKGHFPLVDRDSSRCHPFTVIDDHARYMLCLEACLNEREETVKAALTKTFCIYGLPLRITADNGSPWGSTTSDGLTGLGVWLSLLGVRLSHSRPYHPQTQGKDERFHRTLNLELITRQSFDSQASTQAAFDPYRDQYNFVRPHEACDMKPPATRYWPSPRPFPNALPAVDYPAGDLVRKVSSTGQVTYKDRRYRVSTALCGYPVALRPTEEDAVFDVFFCQQFVRQIHLVVDRLP